MACCCSPNGGGAGGACGTAWSNTWYVDPGFTGGTSNGSPSCPFTTAQAAADAAASGDAIVLGRGDAGDVTISEKSLTFLGLAGTLRGATESELGAVTMDALVTMTNVRVDSIQGDGVTLNGCHVEPGGISCVTLLATETTFVFDAEQIAVSSDDGARFRDCTFDVTGEVSPLYTGGAPRFDQTSAQSFQTGGGGFWSVDPGTRVTMPQDLEQNLHYGDGSDGNLDAGFGVLALTRDMYWENVEFQAGDTIRTNGFRIFVANLLDLRGAPASAINVGFNALITGIDASGQTGGTTPGVPSQGSLPGGSNGGSGGKGGAIGGVGAAGGNAGNSTFSVMGGESGTGGKGGAAAGAGGVPGTYSASNNATTEIRFPRSPDLLRPFVVTVRNSFSGSGGGGGGGGATGVGGGGGAAPTTSSAGEIKARCIIRDSTTDAAAIDCRGVRGGNGGDGTTDGAGGAGAGAGGGAAISIQTDWLLGETDSCIVLDGGAGGNGGNGAGGAAGGVGGTGADSGTVLIGQLIKNQWQYFAKVAGAAGSAASGSTGGAGGAGGVLSVFL